MVKRANRRALTYNWREMRRFNLTRFIPGTREWRLLKEWRRIRRRMFFRSWFPGIFAPDYIPKELYPERTAEDVERIVRRDFPVEQFDAVMAILNEYGTERWHRESFRVQLAVLKMADGSMDRLRTWIKVAKSDYRDVLSPAEYPSQMKTGRHTSERERRRMSESDKQQYLEWLMR